MKEIRPHFSVTQLATYLDCPFKYYLMYVERLQWEKVPSGVAFGSAVHRTIEEFNRSLLGNRMDEESAIALFEKQWNSEAAREEVEYKNQDEPEELMDKGKRLIQLYCQEFAEMKPQAVERAFRLPILDISTGLFEPSRDIMGTVDLIADNEVVELKTSARSMNQREADSSLQLTLYSWAYRMIFGSEEHSLKTISLIKSSKPKVQVIETQRKPEHYTRLIELISQVIRAVELGVFYRNPNTRYGCDGCVYRMVCGGA